MKNKGFISIAALLITSVLFGGLIFAEHKQEQRLGGGGGTIEQLELHDTKVSSNDTTPGFLNGKLIAGANITFTENNNGGNETLEISSTGGGSGTPGGSDEQIQFNDSGSFGGVPDFYYDGANVLITDMLLMFKATPTQTLQFSASLVSGGNNRILNGPDDTGVLVIRDNGTTPTPGECLVWMDTWKVEGQTCGSGGTPTDITVADTTDSTAFVALFESATGDLQPKTDAGITYDASNGTLTSTILNTPTLTLTGTGTLNGLDAIDGTGETTLEAAIDIAGDVDGTGLTAVDLDEAAVESELEGVMDLQDMQGAVTDGQVPNTITIDTATLASNVSPIAGTDATSFIAIFDSATGTQNVKTDANLKWDASSNTLEFDGPMNVGGNARPTTNDGGALGSTTQQWSDGFFAEGGVLNWDNGDVTITQTNDVLAFVANFTFGNGSTAAALLKGVEDTDNGSNFIAFQWPSAITSDVTCTLENDSNPIPDSCVGDGSDGGGGSTAWDAIADPAASATVAFADTTQTITGNTNDTTAIAQSLLLLSFTNDAGTDSLSQRGLVVQNEAGANGMESLLVLDNLDTDTAVTRGLLVSSANGAIVTALDVSDPQIDSALMAGANDLSGTNWSITGSTGTLSIPTIDFTGTGTINGLDAIDATSETTLEAAIDIAGDVTGTGLGSVVVADNAVDGTDIALGSDAQGDVMYYDGTNWVRLAPGTSGQFLKTNGAAANPAWATASGTGDFVGPASSTDNAVVRFDSTTGKLGQNSGVIIGDSNDIALTIANSANVDGLTITQSDATNDKQAITISSAQNSSTGRDIQVTNTDAGARGAFQRFYHNSASSADGDEVGGLDFYNNFASESNIAIASIAAVDVANGGGGFASNQLVFKVAQNPSYTSGTLGAPVTMLQIGGKSGGNYNGLIVGKSTADARIESNGNNDLILATGNSTTGNLTLADGANGNITATTNGSGNLAFSSSTGYISMSSNATARSWRTGGIYDSSGNIIIGTSVVGSAVNYYDFKNAATGGNPVMTASGTDSNIGFDVQTKGTGVFRHLATSSGPADVRWFEDTDNGTNYASIIAPASMASDRVLTLPDATDTLVGKATTDTLTNKTIAAASNVLDECIVVAASDETTNLSTGTAKTTFRMPWAMTLTSVRMNLNTAGTGGTLVTVDINEAGSTILSTKLTTDASEKTSTTAATAAVISDSSLADDAEMTIDIDAVGSTITGKGLKVHLCGTV